MKIAGLHKTSLIDYPDHVAASVFLAGCNLNCSYCYNRWMIDESVVSEAMSVGGLLSWLASRRQLLDGLCVSGGEPTIASDLAQLLSAARDLGFLIKLDTNGTRPECLASLLSDELVDYVAMDVKAPLDHRYGVVAGCVVDLSAIGESMALLRLSGVAYEFRTTAGPLLDEGDLEEIARGMHPGDRWFVQPFESVSGISPAQATVEALDVDTLAKLCARLTNIAPGVRLRA